MVETISGEVDSLNGSYAEVFDRSNNIDAR